MLARPFEVDRFQDVLLVIDSFDQRFDAVETRRRRRLARPARGAA